MNIQPIGFVLLQGTSLCNLNCTYCYLSEQERKTKSYLSFEDISIIFEKILSSPFLKKSQLVVTWHIGEPLMLPIEYYEKAINLINKIRSSKDLGNLKIRHSIQTNGTLIDQKWCEFFREHNIHIGVSMDGPASIHNSYRKYWNGRSTLNEVLRGIELLQENEVDFGVLTTVTPELLENYQEYTKFIKQNNIYSFGINPVVKLAAHQKNLLLLQKYKEQYRVFLSHLFKMVQNSDIPIRVREFQLFFDALHDQEEDFYKSINSEAAPFRLLTVDHQANFSTYSPELFDMKSEKYGNFILGNFRTDSLESVIHTEKFKTLYMDINTGQEKCRSSCDYFSVCGGGKPAYKYSEFNTFDCTETVECDLRVKAVMDTIIIECEKTLS